MPRDAVSRTAHVGTVGKYRLINICPQVELALVTPGATHGTAWFARQADADHCVSKLNGLLLNGVPVAMTAL